MDQVPIEDRPRLLSDNSPGYVSRAFRDYVGMVGIKHILATPFHPQTNGKLERYHQTLKRDVTQVPYEMPSDLEAAIVAFVSYYTGAITRPWATSHPRMSSEAGGKRSYNAEGRCKPKQLNGEDSTTCPSGSSPHLKTAPDLSALKVSQICWLPTATCPNFGVHLTSGKTAEPVASWVISRTTPQWPMRM